MSRILYFEGVGAECQTNIDGAIHRMRIRTAFHGHNSNPVFLEVGALWRETGMKGDRIVYELEPYAHFDAQELTPTAVTANGRDSVVWNSTRIRTGGDVELIDGIWQTTYRYRYTESAVLEYLNNLGFAFDGIRVLPALSGYNAVKRRYNTHRELPYNFGDEFEPDWDLIAKREAIDTAQYEQDIADGIRSPNISFWVDPSDPHLLHYRNFKRKHREEIFRI